MTLEDDVLLALDGCGRAVSFGDQQAIVWEGDSCEAVYFVQSGTVEIYRTALDGREHTLGIMLAGDGFNLVPAFTGGGENPANARSKGETRLLAIRKDDLLRIMQQYPAFMTRVLRDMAERLERMTRKADALALHSVRQRLAAFLIAQANLSIEEPHPFWTREDMARQIGTVRDVIGRNLRKFEEEGLIKREKGNILLLDKGGLERAAMGGDAT